MASHQAAFAYKHGEKGGVIENAVEAIGDANLKSYFSRQQQSSLPSIKCKTAFAFCNKQYQT